jgi:hypothetical protein
MESPPAASAIHAITVISTISFDPASVRDGRVCHRHGKSWDNAFSSAPRSPRANHCGSGISNYGGGLWHAGRPHRWPVEVTEASCETNFVGKT